VGQIQRKTVFVISKRHREACSHLLYSSKEIKIFVRGTHYSDPIDSWILRRVTEYPVGEIDREWLCAKFDGV
jgi:hypothetical protein